MFPHLAICATYILLNASVNLADISWKIFGGRFRVLNANSGTVLITLYVYRAKVLDADNRMLQTLAPALPACQSLPCNWYRAWPVPLSQSGFLLPILSVLLRRLIPICEYLCNLPDLNLDLPTYIAFNGKCRQQSSKKVANYLYCVVPCVKTKY